MIKSVTLNGDSDFEKGFIKYTLLSHKIIVSGIEHLLN